MTFSDLTFSDLKFSDLSKTSISVDKFTRVSDIKKRSDKFRHIPEKTHHLQPL